MFIKIWSRSMDTLVKNYIELFIIEFYLFQTFILILFPLFIFLCICKFESLVSPSFYAFCSHFHVSKHLHCDFLNWVWAVWHCIPSTKTKVQAAVHITLLQAWGLTVTVKNTEAVQMQKTEELFRKTVSEKYTLKLLLFLLELKKTIRILTLHLKPPGS